MGMRQKLLHDEVVVYFPCYLPPVLQALQLLVMFDLQQINSVDVNVTNIKHPPLTAVCTDYKLLPYFWCRVLNSYLHSAGKGVIFHTIKTIGQFVSNRKYSWTHFIKTKSQVARTRPFGAGFRLTYVLLHRNIAKYKPLYYDQEHKVEIQATSANYTVTE